MCSPREDNPPTAVLTGPSRGIKLLSDHRKLLVEQRTGLQAKLRWFLHELDPELSVPSRGMQCFCVLESLSTELAEKPGAVAEMVRDMLSDILTLTHRINAIERQLSTVVRAEYPALLHVPGMGVLGAAMIVGETAGVTRFRNKDCFARFNGTAPIPVWSSSKVRVRLSCGGNRRIGTCLHMAAVPQLRLGAEGAAYFAKQIDAGKTRTEAFRLLRRRISDRAFAALRADAELDANQ